MENGMVKLTADVIIELEDKKIVLIKRGHYPFEGHWAIPGGKLEGNETIQQTALREAKEETGLDIKIERIIGVYSDPNRDPRGRFVSVAFLCRAMGGELHAASDATEFLTTDNPEELKLAFDHNKIISDYIALR